MTELKNTHELSESTEPAISYSTCYLLFIFFSFVKSMKSSQMLKFVIILKILT